MSRVRGVIRSVSVRGADVDFSLAAADSGLRGPVDYAWPPTFTVLPSITGTPAVGETLTGVDGTVSQGTVTARAWLRNGTPISGATGGTYLLGLADNGADIAFRNTATGIGGTATATSEEVGPVTTPAPLKLAGTGLRLATAQAELTTSNNYAARDFAVGTPPVDIAEVAFFFPTFFCNTGAEVDCPNGYTIEGMGTRASGGLRTLGTIDGGTDPVVINPALPATQYGKWIVFTPAAPIPADTVQVFSASYFIPTGFYPTPRAFANGGNNVWGEPLPNEARQASATSLLSTLSGSANYTNAGGVNPPMPSMCMMRPVGSDTFESALIIGDSIQYGSQQSRSATYFDQRMAFGQIETALDDNAGSARIAANNMAIPGWSMTDLFEGADALGSQANRTGPMRQLWALEKARGLNGGRPIADMIWCGHFQNSSNATLEVLLRSARAMTAIWREAIGDEEAPVYWVGPAPNATSTDGYQTLVNQTPATANQAWPSGARWTFAEAHESPTGALRVDGTVQGSPPIWQVSAQDSTDNRDILSVRPFTATLTSAYSGTGPMMLSAAPTVGSWILFIDGGTVINGAPVDAVSGSGPFSVTISIPGSPAISSGATAKEIWTDLGVHPSPLAHRLYRDAIIEGKVALGFTAPPVPDVAPDITASSITGIPQDGQVLTANATVTGTPTPTLAYQWQRNGTNISGQAASTIALNAGTMSLADGNTISCEITATNTAGTDTAEPTATFTVPAPAILVQGATAGYFVDPANVPAATTRITFRGEFWFPTSVAATTLLFSQESTGCDLEVLTNRGTRVTVEDSIGTKLVNGVTANAASSVLLDAWNTFVFDVNMVAQTAVVTLNGGTPVSLAFSTPGTGTFQSNREVSFLAGTAGAMALQNGGRFRNLEVDFNGTLHKAIPNNAATANADAWKRGGNFTEL